MIYTVGYLNEDLWALKVGDYETSQFLMKAISISSEVLGKHSLEKNSGIIPRYPCI